MAATNVRTVAPLTHTDIHDFAVLENGNVAFIANEPARRDLNAIARPDGTPRGTAEMVEDSVTQVVAPDGREVFRWSSRDHQAWKTAAVPGERPVHGVQPSRKHAAAHGRRMQEARGHGSPRPARMSVPRVMDPEELTLDAALALESLTLAGALNLLGDRAGGVRQAARRFRLTGGGRRAERVFPDWPARRTVARAVSCAAGERARTGKCESVHHRGAPTAVSARRGNSTMRLAMKYTL